MYLLLFFITAITLIITSNIYVKPRLLIDGNEIRTSVTINLFMKLIRIKLLVGPGGISKAGRSNKRGVDSKKYKFPEIYEDIHHVVKFYYSAKKPIKYLVKKIEIQELGIVTTIGTDDACHTALTVGVACSIAGIIVSLLTNRFKKCKKNITIIPNFSGSMFDMDLNCILKIKLLILFSQP